MKLEKLASVTEYRPEDLFMLASLGGAGGFGAIRLLNDMLGKASPQRPQQNAVKLLAAPPTDPNAQGLQIPGEKKQQHHQGIEHESMGFSSPKTANEAGHQVAPHGMGEGSGYIESILPLITGLPTGFLGAKFLYDKYKDHELGGQIDDTKKRYMQELQAAQSQLKTAGETPCVDKFCEAIALELNALES